MKLRTLVLFSLLACLLWPGHAPLAIRYPLGSTFLSEIRNFLGRIELLYTKSLWAGVSLGSCYERAPSGCLVLNTRTGENTDYIEQLKATFPWATSVDYQMFVEMRRSQEQGRSPEDCLCTPAQTHSVHCSCQLANSVAFRVREPESKSSGLSK
jgi:hypothetical protein